MQPALRYLAVMAAGTLFATNAFAQSAGDIRGPSPLSPPHPGDCLGAGART